MPCSIMLRGGKKESLILIFQITGLVKNKNFKVLFLKLHFNFLLLGILELPINTYGDLNSKGEASYTLQRP